MADPGRKSLYSKVVEALTLGMFKSKVSKAAEDTTNAVDHVLR
jgi:hypothetical protein